MTKKNLIFTTFCIFLSLVQVSVANAGKKDEPVLTIQSPEKTLVFKRSQLLARKDLTQVEVQNDPAYENKSNTYWAVPFAALFQGISVPPDATLHFRCLDGFGAPISQSRALNQLPTQSIAYLAIERKPHEWPPLKPKKSQDSAGPFYLIWKNPKLSQLSVEEWPFQLKGFEVKKSLRSTYPAIFPESKLAENHPANRGLKIFTKNCFTCHTLNHQGEGVIGPDLNLPKNPTEYFVQSALKSLIRNPQSLRTWPGSRMPGFDSEAISDSDLDDLVSYLEYMSKHKVP